MVVKRFKNDDGTRAFVVLAREQQDGTWAIVRLVYPRAYDFDALWEVGRDEWDVALDGPSTV